MPTGKIRTPTGALPPLPTRPKPPKASAADHGSAKKPEPARPPAPLRGSGGPSGPAPVSPRSGGPAGPVGPSEEKKPPPTADDFFREHQEALAKFDTRDRADLRNFLDVLALDTGGGKLTELLHKDLGILAERLKGQTVGEGEPLFSEVVETLNKRLDDSLAPQLEGRIDKARAMVDLVSSLARPESIIQGQGTATCCAAVVQTMLARQDPLEYAKLATNLLFEGWTRPDGGGRMSLSTGELVDRELGKTTGRGPFNAIIQGSFMNFARELVPDDGTDGASGGRGGVQATYGGGRYSRGATYGSVTEAVDGLTAPQVEALVEKVLQDRAFQINVSDNNREMAFSSILSALGSRTADEDGKATLKKGKSEKTSSDPEKDPVLGAYSKDVKKGNISGVPVGVRTDSGFLHEILVLGVEQDKIVFQDPGDGLTKQVDIAKFKQDMMSVVVPGRPPANFKRA